MSCKENPFQAEREAYQQIEIPDELHYLVKKSIKRAEKIRLAKRKRFIMRSFASVAALLFLTLTIGVNSSYAFSKKVSKVPVVRSVAKVLTVRKYTAEKAADVELQQELAAAQENSEISIEGLVIEAIPEETAGVLPEQTENVDVPMSEEEAIFLEGYEIWAKELTIEKLDLVTELYEVPVVEEEATETEVADQEASEKKADTAKETSAKETTVAKEGNAEKKETVAKEAVSGNDKKTEETGQDTKKEQTADASEDSEEISQEAEDDKILDTILLAELPKEEIRLYGYHENGAVRGVALRIRDSFTCFDWTYLDDRGKLPKLSYADVNEDDEKEIFVFLYNDKNDTQEEENDSDLESADSEKTVKNATEESATDSKTSNTDTKTETEVVKSESGKSADEEAVSANDQEEESVEKKFLDDVSEIWMVSVSEEGMKPELVSREEEESSILTFIKSLFEK